MGTTSSGILTFAVSGGRTSGGCSRPLTSATTSRSPGSPSRAATFYVWKTVLPRGLSPFYELRLPADPWSPPYAAAATVVAAFFALALAARRRCPAALAAWISYLILLLPVSGLFQ